MAKRSSESLLELPDVTDLPPSFVSADLLNEGKTGKHYPKTISILDEATALLKEAHFLREAEGRLKLIKARLTEIIREEGWDGMRSGRFCCMSRYQAGRKTLDRALLVENGVTPEQIEASFKVGDPITVVELPEIVED